MCLQSSPTIRDCVFEGNWSLDIERTSVGGAVSSGSGAVTLIRCVFRGNRADIGGAIFGGFALIQDCTFCENEAGVEGGAMDLVRCEPLITGCTLAGNSAPMGGGIFASICPARIEKTIIANSTQGAALVVSDSEVTLSCCDLVGNAGGDWVGSIADQYGVDGNICEDPLFCGAGCDDLALHADSPCAPEHNPDCGLVGAWPVGCEQAPIEVTTWGAIKALFR